MRRSRPTKQARIINAWTRKAPLCVSARRSVQDRCARASSVSGATLGLDERLNSLASYSSSGRSLITSAHRRARHRCSDVGGLFGATIRSVRRLKRVSRGGCPPGTGAKDETAVLASRQQTFLGHLTDYLTDHWPRTADHFCQIFVA